MLTFLSPTQVYHSLGRHTNRRPTCHLTSQQIVSSLATSFQSAISKRHVSEFGRIVPVDKHGRAFPSTDLKIPSEYQGVLDFVVKHILENIRNTTVRAIFIRGSLVTGNFRRDGCLSDIDLIVFTDDKLSDNFTLKLRSTVSRILSEQIRESSTDILFESGRRKRSIFPSDVKFCVGASMCSLLRHYSLPLFGSLNAINVPDGLLSPYMDLAKDIREQERRFKVLFSGALKKDDINLQKVAVQWILKRCLRAVADECMMKSLFHCRDLVPAYKLVSTHFPDFASTFLKVLQLACANESNSYAGLGSQQAYIKFCTNVIPDAVEIVEQVFLENHFKIDQETGRAEQISHEIRKQLLPSTKTSVGNSAQRLLLSGWSCAVRLLRSHERQPHTEKKFFTCALPKLAISPSVFGTKQGIIKTFEKGEVKSLTDMVGRYSEPVLIRNAAKVCGIETGTGAIILDRLEKLHPTVECRLSFSNVVTFCRSRHKYISDRTFTPPSIVVQLSPQEAVQRMCRDCELPHLLYNQYCEREHIYIQTPVLVADDQYFPPSDKSTGDIAQEEKLWISTHGTVSSLHYDSSHSALFQRVGTKKMIFFSDEALNSLSVYPFGHPLHRRARVNICRSSSVVFTDFWRKWSGAALEVNLNPGDLLVFPPFWAHYTESFGEQNGLCVSHTLRFW